MQQQFQRRTGRTQLTAHAQQVTLLGGTTGQRLPGGQAAEYRHRQAQRATRGVPANQAEATRRSHLLQAVRKTLQPRRIGLRQGQRQGEAQRRGAHAGQIAGRYG